MVPHALRIGSSGNVPLKVFKLERLSLVLPLSTFAPIHLTLCLTANTSTLEILQHLAPTHSILLKIGFSFALHVLRSAFSFIRFSSRFSALRKLDS